MENGVKVEIWRSYRREDRSETTEMRPYIPGESLAKIIVMYDDIPEIGGMIARSDDDHERQWYVGPNKFNGKVDFEKHNNI